MTTECLYISDLIIKHAIKYMRWGKIVFHLPGKEIYWFFCKGKQSILSVILAT